MKKSDIYEIAIKILGLYLIFKVLDSLKELITYLSFLNNPSSMGLFDQTPVIAITVFNFLIVTLFAWLLIFKTKTVTTWICKKEDYQETAKLFTEKKTIIEIALILFGLIVIVWTVPDFAVKLKNHINLLQNEFTVNMNDKGYIYIAGLKSILGIIAIAYAKSIASALTKKEEEIGEE